MITFPAILRETTLKVLQERGRVTYGHGTWPTPTFSRETGMWTPGEWKQVDPMYNLIPCRFGLHGTWAEALHMWTSSTDRFIYIMERDTKVAPRFHKWDKFVVQRARLLAKLPITPGLHRIICRGTAATLDLINERLADVPLIVNSTTVEPNNTLLSNPDWIWDD